MAVVYFHFYFLFILGRFEKKKDYFLNFKPDILSWIACLNKYHPIVLQCILL